MPETVVHFQIRMPPVLHEQLASWAKEDKASLNALIVGILERGDRSSTRPRPPPPRTESVSAMRLPTVACRFRESALSAPGRSGNLVLPIPR